MWVIGQGLPPGVKDGYRTGLGTKEFGVHCHLLQGLGRCLKEYAIARSLIEVEQLVQFSRDGEYHMEVPAHRQSTFQLVNPDELLGVLTLIAMSVATGVVGYLMMITLVTSKVMTTQGCRTTSFDIEKSFDLIRTQLVFVSKRATILPEYVSQIQRKSFVEHFHDTSGLIKRTFNRRINGGQMQIDHCGSQ
jgi:hypothetical protein